MVWLGAVAAIIAIITFAWQVLTKLLKRRRQIAPDEQPVAKEPLREKFDRLADGLDEMAGRPVVVTCPYCGTTHSLMPSQRDALHQMYCKRCGRRLR
jgi:hypothetical protein